MLRYLAADVICSEKRTVFRERSSRKTMRFEEQIMSKDKYLSKFFKSNGGYCVYYPSYIFRNTQDMPVCHYCQSCQSFSIGFQNFHVFQFRFRFSRKHMLEEKVHHFKGKYNSVKDKSKIRVVNKVTGNLTTFREQDQSNIAFHKMCKPP